MRAYLVNKILSGFSTILSVIVAITCSWILFSLLYQKYPSKKQDCNDDSYRYEHMCKNSTATAVDDQHDSTDAVVVEGPETKAKSANIYFTEFYEMDQPFCLIASVCVSCAIVAALTQFICSLVIICSPAHKIATRSRGGVVILFIAFVVFLVCFSWPLAYKRDYSDKENTLHSISTLNTSVKDWIMNFQMEHFLKDLTAYYVELFANILFLFIYMVTSCCLLRCNESQEFYT